MPSARLRSQHGRNKTPLRRRRKHDGCLRRVLDVQTDTSNRLDAMIEPSFDDFYVREFRPMVALAAAVAGSHLLAEDIAQEAMTRVYGRWDRVSRYDKPGAFARRIVINLAASRRRRDAVAERGRTHLGLLQALPPPDEPHEAVWAAIASLSPNQRAAVALHYLEDRPIDEIAEILGCAPPTARVHLHRARARLATLLEGEDR
jgi:RNA polymerase sigma-70 factor, ECF subfamily